MANSHIRVNGIPTEVKGDVVLGNDGTVQAHAKYIKELRLLIELQCDRIKALEERVKALEELEEKPARWRSISTGEVYRG